LASGGGLVAVIGPGRADVWLVEVDDPRFLAVADSGLATRADRARASAMTDPEAGRGLLARRGTLRRILARYVGGDPAELRIVTAPGGKPVLTHGPAFSVSHAAGLYVVAVNDASSVGVDVEGRRRVERAVQIAERWFSEHEAAALADLPPERHEEEFLRVWCGKEALAKRHGAGLRLMKGRGEGTGGALDVHASLGEGRLRYFEPGHGYVGALASADPVSDITIIRPPEDLWTT
jgi:4'-phosphopantetheinyl transferase